MPAKKAATKKKPPPGGGLGNRTPAFHVIGIQNADPTPTLKIVVHMNDQVSWGNGDGVPYWVSFPLHKWPFKGRQKQIKVRAGEGSSWHKVSANPGYGTQVLYSYAIKKHPDDHDPPPDGPGVIADGG